jgi:hypothetical protein
MPREIPRKKIEIVRYEDMRVSLDHYWKDRRMWRMYKTVPVFAAKEYEDILVKDPDTKFIDWVAGEVNAFMSGEAKVAADIRAPVMNIADDVLNGRAPVIKAGDYIALQTHYQKK